MNVNKLMVRAIVNVTKLMICAIALLQVCVLEEYLMPVTPGRGEDVRQVVQVSA